MFLLNAVAYNSKRFTRQGYYGAREARQEMELLGFPSERDFGNMVRSTMIVNCPVTFEDVNNAKVFFGHNFTSLKGRSSRRKPSSVVTNYVEIPREILDFHK